MSKKTIFSGIKPTGDLHLGNYLGAISQWLEIQEKYNSIFCVVDYHAITTPQDPKKMPARILDIARIYLASGINPKKSIIFRQSDIKEHAELAWLLNCASARMSDLENMTQYKDQITKQKNPSLGIFDYPVLMAADILLYNTDIVPVGHDQLQHVELTRDLAKRFNHDYKPVFKIPEALIRKEGARIMSLDNPLKKMSKSDDSDTGYIALIDKPEIAKKKIMRATTDTGNEIKYDKENKPGITNLLTIYSLLAKTSIASLEKKYQGKGYGDFKKDLAEVVANFLENFQKNLAKYSNKEVEKILANGAKKMSPVACEKVKQVKTALGL